MIPKLLWKGICLPKVDLFMWQLLKDPMKSKKKRITDWKPPVDDHLKFNMDESVLDKPGPVGVGEVIYESRVFNSFADSLAKMGANFDGDFMEWGDV
ncbi:hypothetical protein Ddye_014469 [Dipteronia dyeriana]|uniref:Uncharacterized protein n=1 Tax=Dipteronia dyeriana TaxID=168575 RepID=A0AAE0CL69_9ROSI|nr:hypothetical protein Ddye_014469 [Dipteronia dyeriana]